MNPEELARMFDGAGFANVRVVRHSLPVVFDGGPPQMVVLLAAASVGPQVAVLDEKGRGDLVAATALALAPRLHNGTVCADGVARRSCHALT